MQPRPLRLILLLLAVTGPAWADATIEGRIALAKSRTAPVANQRYEIVGHGDVLTVNPPLAVVYLEGGPASPPPAVSAEVAQRDMAFVPALLAVQAGTRVEFPNHDNFYHNIFSYSPAKRFDLGRYRPDEPVPAVVFDTAGLVVLRCDIHEHMRGLIVVVPTGHFTVTDSGGRYQLTGVPAGHYVLKAWIDSRTTLERPVELTEGGTLRVDFP
jgi:plastocyanin